jgi:hypothetical protein
MRGKKPVWGLVLVLISGARADDATTRDAETIGTSEALRVSYSGYRLEECDEPSFAIPFEVENGEQVDYVALYVSRDAGMSWLFAAKARRDDRFLNYTAPGESTYLVAIQVVLVNGRHFPRLVHDAETMLAVRVKSKKRARR